MLNPKQFSANLTFEKDTYPDPEDGSTVHRVAAHKDGEHVGTIEWGGSYEAPDPEGWVRAIDGP